jgi:hypothetical protein
MRLRRSLSFCLFQAVLVLASTRVLANARCFGGEAAADHPAPKVTRAAQSATFYKIQAGIQGEIFPVFANYASLLGQEQRSFGIVSITITNSGKESLRQRVAVSVVGWSDEEIQLSDVPAGGQHTLNFAPSFLPRFYKNREITAATVHVTFSDLTGTKKFDETTVPVRLRSAEDIYWGNGFKNAQFIASWVTPHDETIEKVLAEAKLYTPDRRLPGYENWKTAAEQEQETFLEAKAIYNAVKKMGLSYVKSSATLGGNQPSSERVRMPRVTLSHNSGNCIDAAVLYASLFENLGMEPSVIIVPGHAYVGVRVSQGSSELLFLDAALTGRSSFTAAVSSANIGLAKHPASATTKVMIEEARSSGIYPMP